MDAIDLLEAQHREVEDLFTKLDEAEDAATKARVFVALADGLAIHTSIEEHHFYPVVKAKGAEDHLVDAFEDDHLSIKRALGELLDTDIDDPSFDDKLDVLRVEVERHVEEEEADLFPRVLRLLDESELEELGEAMGAEQADLEERGNAREAVPAALENAP